MSNSYDVVGSYNYNAFGNNNYYNNASVARGFNINSHKVDKLVKLMNSQDEPEDNLSSTLNGAKNSLGFFAGLKVLSSIISSKALYVDPNLKGFEKLKSGFKGYTEACTAAVNYADKNGKNLIEKVVFTDAAWDNIGDIHKTLRTEVGKAPFDPIRNGFRKVKNFFTNSKSIKEVADQVSVQGLAKEVVSNIDSGNLKNITNLSDNIDALVKLGTQESGNEAAKAILNSKTGGNISLNTLKSVGDSAKQLEKQTKSFKSYITGPTGPLSKSSIMFSGGITALLSTFTEIIPAFKIGTKEGFKQIGKTAVNFAVDTTTGAVGEVAGKVVGGVAGKAIGKVIGSIVGTPLGPVGMVAGQVIGGMLGSCIASWAGRKISEKVIGKSEVKIAEEKKKAKNIEKVSQSPNDLLAITNQAKMLAQNEINQNGTISNKTVQMLNIANDIENDIVTQMMPANQSVGFLGQTSSNNKFTVQKPVSINPFAA